MLKKCGKVQNVVSSSDFEIFSPELHAVKGARFGKSQLSNGANNNKMSVLYSTSVVFIETRTNAL